MSWLKTAGFNYLVNLDNVSIVEIKIIEDIDDEFGKDNVWGVCLYFVNEQSELSEIVADEGSLEYCIDYMDALMELVNAKSICAFSRKNTEEIKKDAV